MMSVHRKVMGYGSTPTASGMGTSTPITVKLRSMNRVSPRTLSIVSEPKKSPDTIKKTSSRRAWRTGFDGMQRVFHSASLSRHANGFHPR